MKQFLLSCIPFILSSCTYQYVTLSSEQLSTNEKNDFVMENDTLKVTYRFNGDNSPVKITIYNKTNEPLEVNWRKSALILNGEALGYYSPNLFVKGSIEQDTANRFYGGRSFLADVSADIHVNEPSQFIPPQSSISKIPLSLPVHFVELPVDQLRKASLNSSNSYTIKYKKIEYSPEKSPISFRSYLNFNYGGDPVRAFSLDHHFYVSEIWQSAADPMNFPPQVLDRGDLIY
jgi:hypothetical protein